MTILPTGLKSKNTEKRSEYSKNSCNNTRNPPVPGIYRIFRTFSSDMKTQTPNTDSWPLDVNPLLKRFPKAPSGDANTPDGINREVGRKLLYALWDAGYSLRLVPSTRPAGWTIVPIGEATPSGDLLKLFDENHDAAVALLLEACRTAQCRPEDWPPLHLLYAATKYDGGGVSEL